jgi:hypothetical protein
MNEQILRNCTARRRRNQSSADFQVCCVADFQIRKPSKRHRAADLEVGDTAGLETCATPWRDASRCRRAPCLLWKSSRLATNSRETGRGKTLAGRAVSSSPHEARVRRGQGSVAVELRTSTCETEAAFSLFSDEGRGEGRGEEFGFIELPLTPTLPARSSRGEGEHQT